MIDLQTVTIEPAATADIECLTRIAFSAKQHWNYPSCYLELWKNELTISADYILKNIVYKASAKDVVTGFYSIVNVENDFYAGEVFVQKGYWIEHIFILPEYHKQGIGRLLIDHAKQVARNTGIQSLMIFVDPFAQGFYEKIGAKFVRHSKSSIKDRMIPVYNLKIIH